MGAPYNYRILSLELFVEHLNKALQDKRIWQDLYDHKTPLVSINYYIYIYIEDSYKFLSYKYYHP